MLSLIASFWCLAYAHWGRITIGAKGFAILTGTGWRRYRYREIRALAVFQTWTEGSGIEGALLRRRLGRQTVNLYVKLAPAAVRMHPISSFEGVARILHLLETRSRRPVEEVTYDNFKSWRDRRHH